MEGNETLQHFAVGVAEWAVERKQLIQRLYDFHGFAVLREPESCLAAN